jgi:hypothetical protein
MYIAHYFFKYVYNFIVVYFYQKIQDTNIMFLDTNVWSDAPITDV